MISSTDSALEDHDTPITVSSGAGLKELITQAERGDLTAAWAVVAMIEIALEAGTGDEQLFAYARKFFAALLDLREASQVEVDSAKALLPALKSLHIVRGRGQPARSEEDLDRLAVRMVFAMDLYQSIEEAADQLAQLRFKGEKGPEAASAYSRAYSGKNEHGTERGPQFDHLRRHGVLSDVELASVAGVSCSQVKQRLKNIDVKLLRKKN